MVIAQTNEQVDDLTERLATAPARACRSAALRRGVRAFSPALPGTRT